MNIFTRKYYTEKIDHWLGRHQIIVPIGQGRVGKSFIMKDFMNRHASDDSSNIIRFDISCLVDRIYIAGNCH